MKQRNHIVITGTGRAGTTFLVELLTNLGLETGFDATQMKHHKTLGRAGLEYNVKSDDCPYIVKDPWFCDYADEIIARDDIIIEHVFIPIRNLNAAAESRRFVTKNGIKEASLLNRIKFIFGKNKTFAGGLWHINSLKSNGQENILLNQLYKLMLAISDSAIDVTLIKYPRSTKDSAYVFDKLKPVLKDMSFENFSEVFNKTVQPELVNSFNKDDC